MKKIMLLIFTFALISVKALNAQVTQESKTGLLKPSEDYLKRLPHAAAASVPDDFVPDPKADLSDQMPLPGNQGSQGSCAAFTAVYDCLTYIQNRKNNTSATVNGAIDSLRTYSPKYLYNLLKMTEVGISDCQGGVLLSKILDGLRDKGSPTLRDLPYKGQDAMDCLSPILIEQLSALAEENKILTYDILTSFNTRQFQYLLTTFNPIIIGMDLDSNFVKKGYTTGQHGELFVYKFDPGKPYLGYHALLVTGYEQSTGCFKILNSWGSSFGTNGYFFMKYQDLIGSVKEAYIAKANTTTAIAPTALVSNESRTYSLDNRGRYQGYFRLGFFKKFGKYNIGVNYVNKIKGEVIVSVLTPSKKTLIANLLLFEDDTKYFYYNKEKINITFSGIDIDGVSSLKNDVLLTIKVSPDSPDPVIRKMLN